MGVVEEEVFGENIQFVVDLKQMHQDLLLQRRPARASMGSQELTLDLGAGSPFSAVLRSISALIWL